jgi:hypothetical protein
MSQSRAQSLDALAQEIRNAPDPIAEGEAIKRFREYAIDHGLTYQVVSYDAATGARLADPAGRSGAVRTDVAVYRAEQHVYSFSFRPRDTSNVALIAKG